jgi:polysaccharide biosynthesis/export protein
MTNAHTNCSTKRYSPRGVVTLLVMVAFCGMAAAADDRNARSTEAASTTPPTPMISIADMSKVRIGAGDLLEVSVFDIPELTQRVRVDSAGDAGLLLIGGTHVAGLTVSEANRVIETKLLSGDFVREPRAAVLVLEYATQGVSVLGEVARPGVYPALGPRKLFDLISSAGGLTQRAGREITITRRDGTGPSTVVKIEDPGLSNAGNLEVFPGDTLAVSKAGLVYVLGDVGRPGGFMLQNSEHLTALQAIALAMGVNRTASVNGARLIRKTPTGGGETALMLKKIMEAKEPDVALQPDDIIFVPVSMPKSVGAKTLQAVLQMATGAVVYATR